MLKRRKTEKTKEKEQKKHRHGIPSFEPKFASNPQTKQSLGSSLLKAFEQTNGCNPNNLHTDPSTRHSQHQRDGQDQNFCGSSRSDLKQDAPFVASRSITQSFENEQKGLKGTITYKQEFEKKQERDEQGGLSLSFSWTNSSYKELQRKRTLVLP